MTCYPFKLQGVTKSPIWGGTRLINDWNKTTACGTVGESWELTVRRDAVSTVVNGEYAGQTLGELLQRYPDEIMGRSSYTNGEFPLLIKLIDAADRLSVQVHPDDAYAARVENDRGKTEMWYIVEADPDAEIVCGLVDGVTAKDYARAVAAGDYESLLKRVPVQAGDCYFIPAGLTHAIGKGILIAELQQNCDLTYRVYDYDRRGADGSPRELHTEKALEVIRPFSAEEIEAIRYANAQPSNKEVLADCRYFRTEIAEMNGATRELSASTRVRHLLCIGGSLTLTYSGGEMSIGKGDSVLLPAALSASVLNGNGTVLLTTAY